jgi:hypothetical protein
MLSVVYSFFKLTPSETGMVPAQLGPLKRVGLNYWTLKEGLNRVLVLLMTSGGDKSRILPTKIRDVITVKSISH